MGSQERLGLRKEWQYLKQHFLKEAYRNEPNILAFQGLKNINWYICFYIISEDGKSTYPKQCLTVKRKRCRRMVPAIIPLSNARAQKHTLNHSGSLNWPLKVYVQKRFQRKCHDNISCIVSDHNTMWCEINYFTSWMCWRDCLMC